MTADAPTATYPATPAQRAFIANLAAERELDEAQRSWVDRQLDRDDLLRYRASEIIEHLLARPKVERGARDYELAPVPADLPDGYYALAGRDKTHFYRVRTSQRGSRFLDEQAGDRFWPVKGVDHRRSVILACAAAPREAMALYGQLIGRCGVCGRTLTDPTSRALGIGPWCRGEREGRSDDDLDAEDIYESERRAEAEAFERDEALATGQCPRCQGRGEVVIASHDLGDGCFNDDFDTCPACQGSGRA